MLLRAQRTRKRRGKTTATWAENAGLASKASTRCWTCRSHQRAETETPIVAAVVVVVAAAAAAAVVAAAMETETPIAAVRAQTVGREGAQEGCCGQDSPCQRAVRCG